MPGTPNPTAAWDVSPSMSALAPESTATVTPRRPPTPPHRVTTAMTSIPSSQRTTSAWCAPSRSWREIRIGRRRRPGGVRQGSPQVAQDQPLRRPGRVGPPGRDQPDPGRTPPAQASRPCRFQTRHTTADHDAAGRTRRIRTPALRPPQAATGGGGVVLRRRTVDRRDRRGARHRGGLGEVAPARRPATAQADPRE